MLMLECDWQQLNLIMFNYQDIILRYSMILFLHKVKNKGEINWAEEANVIWYFEKTLLIGMHCLVFLLFSILPNQEIQA